MNLVNYRKKLKIVLPYDPAIYSWAYSTNIFFIVVLGRGTLCHLQKFLQYIKFPQIIESRGQTNICTPIFTVALSIIVKRWKRTQVPMIDEWKHKT
jgi:hypothetical protein